MDINKFMKDYPQVVQDARDFHARFSDLSKVKRELSRRYTDPTGQDDEKRYIMQYVNGHLESLLGITQGIDRIIQSFYENLMRAQGISGMTQEEIDRMVEEQYNEFMRHRKYDYRNPPNSSDFNRQR